MKNARFPIEEFNETIRLNPYWSSWTCFTEIVWKRKGLSKKTIRRHFDLLVDEDDYERKYRRILLEQLYALSEGRIL